MIDGKYFDANDVLSRNCMLNVVFGKREIGKSYGMMRRACARRVRNHEGMVWVRPTAEAAQTLASSFGNDKWQKLWTTYGYEKDRFKRVNGNRIVYKDGNEWRPLIRYWGLSEWEDARDNDDPSEAFLYLDEFVMAPESLRRYCGQPAKHLLDMWVSLRRGKPKMPVLLAGNPEKGVDWFLPFLGVEDRQTPERVRIYNVAPKIAKEYKTSAGETPDKVAVLWTTNPGGQSVGGKTSGTAGDLPEELVQRRCGLEKIYGNFDLGYGLVSLWYGKDCVIVDTVRGPGWVIRNFPDGNRETVVYSSQIKRQMIYLREFWRAGRVRFASPEAYKRFQMTAGRLI